MNAIVVSDLHLGSRFCRYDRLLKFIRDLPPGYDLVLNGDTIDRWHKRYLENHKEAMDLLAAESLERRVIWLRGNHDKRMTPRNTGRIEFGTTHNIDDMLFISHGHKFDHVMPINKVFIIAFRYIHHLRISLGAEPMHVALYAKRFRRLYDMLRTNIRTNAVRYAKKHGFKAVTCGHTHSVEDNQIDGVRYINTGAWTEDPIFYLKVTGNEIQLIEVSN
jgi:UDP-2,3-diacylglucosamine pyrophosphatase LpxH